MDSIVEDAIDEAEGDPAQDRRPEPDPQPVDASDDVAPSGNMSEQELQDVLEELETSISVVGCGGGNEPAAENGDGMS